ALMFVSTSLPKPDSALEEKESGRRSDRFLKYLERWRRLTSAALSAVATTATITTTATATATATASRRARFARARFINRESPAFEGLTVNFRDCLLRICIGAHCDKGEAARFAGELVLHQHDFLHRASLREKLL